MAWDGLASHLQKWRKASKVIQTMLNIWITYNGAERQKICGFVRTHSNKWQIPVSKNPNHHEEKSSWPSPCDKKFMTLTVENSKCSWPSSSKKWNVRDPPWFFRSPPGAVNNVGSLIVKKEYVVQNNTLCVCREYVLTKKKLKSEALHI